MYKRWERSATILQPTIKIAGRRLLPFCLFHRVTLESIESPLLGDPSKATPYDLILGARIMSTTRLEDVRKKLSFMERFRMLYYESNKTAFYVELTKLSTYFKAQSLWPKFWEKEEKANNKGIPWHLAVISGLVRNGLTLNEAWTIPESQAIWIHISNCIVSGAKIEVVSDEEQKLMDDYLKQK